MNKNKLLLYIILAFYICFLIYKIQTTFKLFQTNNASTISTYNINHKTNKTIRLLKNISTSSNTTTQNIIQNIKAKKKNSKKEKSHNNRKKEQDLYAPPNGDGNITEETNSNHYINGNQIIFANLNERLSSLGPKSIQAAINSPLLINGKKTMINNALLNGTFSILNNRFIIQFTTLFINDNDFSISAIAMDATNTIGIPSDEIHHNKSKSLVSKAKKVTQDLMFYPLNEFKSAYETPNTYFQENKALTEHILFPKTLRIKIERPIKI